MARRRHYKRKTRAQKRWGISRRTSITIGVVGVVLLTLVRLDAFRDLRHGMKNSDSFASFVTSNLRVTSEPNTQETTSSGWSELKGANTEDYPTPDIPNGAVELRVERIVDGDTVYMKDGTKVRLHGIDTPERDQPYGQQATRNLDELIGSTVYVVEKDTDRYGRLVGTLYNSDGTNVNLEMVCNGSAWWYSRYAKSDLALANCQDKAEEAGLGLWADSDRVAPWEWRRR